MFVVELQSCQSLNCYPNECYFVCCMPSVTIYVPTFKSFGFQNDQTKSVSNLYLS